MKVGIGYTLIVFIFAVVSASAQSFTNDPSDLTSTHLKQEGQLVSVQIVIGEPLKLFVLGREEAKLDFSDLKLSVRRLTPYPAKVLQVTKFGDYYTVSESDSLNGPSKIEVKAKVKNKEETFQFQIETKPH